MANEHLKRTPTSIGNNRVLTWSGWVKRSKLSNAYVGSQNFFRASNGSGGDCGWRFDYSTPSDGLRVHLNGSAAGNVQGDAKHRDPSSWMNVMLAFNSTLEQSSARVRMYIDGVLMPDNNTGYPSQNYQTSWNELVPQYIGTYNGSLELFHGEMCDIFMVDGQALTPDVFGFYKEGKGYQSSGTTQATDFRPGQWSPHSPRKIKTEIERRGGFGVNGFYLPMNDSSNFGADFHCTPNSIIKLKGEDLPQPRNGAPTTSDAYVSQLREDPYAANLVLAVPGVELENTNPELVTNGDFSNGTTGWTGLSGGSLSVEDGRLKITETTGALDAYAVNSTAITTVVGRRYTIKWTFHEGTNTTFTVRFGNSGNQSQEYQSNTGANGYGSYPDPGTYSFTFTATATTLNLSFIVNQASSYGYVSNVSVKEAVAVRDYSADIKGSGTNKTVTGVGLAGVYPVPSYYGSAMRFGNDGTNGAGTTDMINVPTSSDFVFNGDVTIECWLYLRSSPTVSGAFLGQWQSGGGTNRNIMMYLDPSNRITSYFNSGGNNYNTGASPALELNQWHHIATEKDGDKFRLYVNGVCVGIRATTPTAGNTSAVSFTIGAEAESGGTITGADYGIDGYIQDVRVYKGAAKYKGGFDVPKPYTPVGIHSWRQVPDTFKNNFATLNSADYNPSTTALSDGNLTANATSNNGVVYSATYNVPNSGKYYFEFYEKVIDVTTTNYISIVSASDDSVYQQYRGYGYIYTDGVQATGYATMAEGDLVGVGIDADNGTVSFYKNGTLVATVTSSSVDHVRGARINSYLPRGAGSYPPGDTRVYNFGQNPTFSGTIPAGTYTDSNGRGLFKYAPPTGFLALCEDNLPTPAIANPGEHFKTVLYTGTGSSRAVTGVGFKPDFVWIKNRDSTYQHQVYDSVRGAGQKLQTSNTNAESTDTANVSSFDSNGFSFAGGNVGVNQDTKNHVAWCWKAGGAAVPNTDGTITSQVSANQTAGFSIATYSGGSGTVGHGLGKKPSLIIEKKRGTTGDWLVTTDVIDGSMDYLRLNLTNSAASAVISAPTSTVFTPNIGASTVVAYIWAEIEGYSKFGSYTGNGSVDGPFVYCGFKPAFLMIKRTDTTGEWWMYDSSRGSTNPNARMLMANNTSVEQEDSASYLLDFLSNGFKWRSGLAASNGSGGSFIFMAFAESPFQTANAK